MKSGDNSAAREALADAIGQVAKGEQSALQVVYTATSAKLFGICCRILNDPREAEDALQDTYLDLWKSAERFDRTRASPISWLAAMARNRAIDRLRAGGKVRAGAVEVDAAFALQDDRPAADQQIEAVQRTERIYACMNELDSNQREAIRRAFFTGVTYRELAEIDAVPLGTMKSWIRRGLAQLKQCMERS